MLLADMMKLTPSSRNLNKISFTHLVQEFPTIYGTSRYVVVFMKPDIGFCCGLNEFSLHFHNVVL